MFSCRMLKVYMCIVCSLSLTAEADPYGCPSLSPKPWYCLESVEVFKSLCPGCVATPCNLRTVLQLLVSRLHLQTCPFLPGHCLTRWMLPSCLFSLLCSSASERSFLVDLKFCCWRKASPRPPSPPAVTQEVTWTVSDSGWIRPPHQGCPLASH